MEPGWWCGSSLGLDLFLHLFHALFCSDGRTCIDESSFPHAKGTLQVKRFMLFFPGCARGRDGAGGRKVSAVAAPEP